MNKWPYTVLAAATLSLATTACMAEAAPAKDAKPVPAERATRVDPVAAMSAEAKNYTAIKTVDSAYAAMREVRAARIAIFDGAVDRAAAFVKDAQANLGRAKTDMERLAASEPKMRVADGLVPFDASLTLTEDYAAQPEKVAAVNKANEHLKKGDHAKAMETLRLAGINVETAAAFIPIEPTQKLLGSAATLIGEGKYYEANLQLKAIEDSVAIAVYDLEGVPKGPAKPAAAAPRPAAPASSK